MKALGWRGRGSNIWASLLTQSKLPWQHSPGPPAMPLCWLPWLRSLLPPNHYPPSTTSLSPPYSTACKFPAKYGMQSQALHPRVLDPLLIFSTSPPKQSGLFSSFLNSLCAELCSLGSPPPCNYTHSANIFWSWNWIYILQPNFPASFMIHFEPSHFCELFPGSSHSSLPQ